MSTTNKQTITEQKIAALAEHLDIDTEDIGVSDYTDMIFVTAYDNEDYLICTDTEADEYAEEEIRNSLYAFNPEFVLPYTILPANAEDALVAIMAGYEDANPAIESLIPDMEEFINDAIGADGRGHFLNFYDGEEYEVNGFFIYVQ